MDGTVWVASTSATEPVKYCRIDSFAGTDIKLDDAASDCDAAPLNILTAHFCDSTDCTLLHTASPA